MSGILTRGLGPNLENPETRITGGLLQSIMDKYGKNTASGKNITPQSAVRMVAVYRAASLLAGLIGSLPLKTFREGEESVVVPILEDPCRGMTKFEWRELLGGHLALNGNYDAFKVYDSSGTQVVELLPYKMGRVRYKKEQPHADNPSGRLYEIISDEGTPAALLTDREVFHVPLFSLDGFVGLSPIQVAREAIGGALAAEEYANKLWASGVLAAGILTTEQRLKEPQAERLKERWKARVSGVDAAYDIAVLDAGTKFDQLTITPQDAQFLDERKFSVDEIARLYGLPPHLLSQQERQTSWGTGIEQNNLGFVVYTFNPIWVKRIEERLELLTPGEPGSPQNVKVEFQLQGLLRGDAQTRSEYYNKMVGIDAMTINEVRKLENLPPVPWGDERPSINGGSAALPPITEE